MIRSPGWRRHLLRASAASAAVFVLAACSGDGGDHDLNVTSVASFGDSLSDLGAYQWGPVAAADGGRYTTNAGKLWVEHVAEHYGTWVERNRTGGTGNPSPSVSGGLGYAQGGARVALQPGYGGTPSGTAGVPVEAGALPIRQQVDAHLAATGGSIPLKQLILMMGGANDIFFALDALEISVVNGTPPAVAQQTAAAAITKAANDLAGEVRRLVAAGATKVVVADVPNVALTPAGAAASADARALMTALTELFNGTVAQGIAGLAGVVRIDSNAWITQTIANPAATGFANVGRPACTFPSPLNPASLFCSRATLAEPGAENAYLFADGVHPSAGGHRAFANYVIDRIRIAIPKTPL
jgi:phospholipase/lecithinase/hemolysin